MNIRKRGRFFECRVRLAGISKSKTFDTKQQARAWGEKAEYEIRQGVLKKASPSDKVLFDDVISDFADNCKHMYTNYKREVSRVTYLLEFDGWPKCFSELKKSHVKRFIKSRFDQGRKTTTINRDLSTISKICTEFNNNYDANLINPVLGQKVRLAEEGERERRLNRLQLEKIRSNLRSDNLRLVMDFALATTMRRSEIATLTWGKVNFEKRTLLLAYTKNKTARTVPLSTKAIAVLEHLFDKDKEPDELVSGVSADIITRSYTAAVKKSEFYDFRFHDLRHEAISRLFEETDLNFFEVMAIPGHKTTVALKRYIHLKSHQLVDRLG